tara:strand:+ start:2078 stop:2371 length:294 start_codon:yes stop_codon:yes gene_type:complete
MVPQEPISLESKIEVPGHIFSEKIDGSFFVLNSKDGQYYELSGTSSEIWEIINQKNPTITSLIRDLNHIYSSDLDIQDDLLVFIDELLKKSVIKINI